jgi:hypothetical protein
VRSEQGSFQNSECGPPTRDPISPYFCCAIARGGIDVPGVIRLLRLSLAGENRSTGLRIASTVEQGGVYLPVADGLAAAHQKRIPKGQLADKFRCVLKAPRKAYRLYRVEWITPRWRSCGAVQAKTSDLRPGRAANAVPAHGRHVSGQSRPCWGAGRRHSAPSKAPRSARVSPSNLGRMRLVLCDPGLFVRQLFDSCKMPLISDIGVFSAQVASVNYVREFQGGSTGGEAHRHCGRVERDAKPLSVSCRQRGGAELLEEHRNNNFPRSRVPSCRAPGNDSPRAFIIKQQ